MLHVAERVVVPSNSPRVFGELSAQWPLETGARELEPLTQLVIMWCGVFFAVLAARKTKLTPVLYFLFVGAVLVNVGVLPVETHPFIRGFAEIGIIVIMFAIGFEEDTSNFLQSIKRSWGIALFGAIGPFVAAYSVAQYFWGDTHISLMCGLTMTATAVSLTMVSLKSEGLHKTRAATGIMTSAVLDDIGSLALVAILVPVATGDAPAGIAEVAWIMGKAVLFFLGVIVLGAWVLPHESTGFLAHLPLIRQFGVKHVFALVKGEHTTLVVLTIAVLVGLAAHALGFHPAVGAYMAGLVLKEEYFFLHGTPDRKNFEKTKTVVDDIAFSWIGPIFFVDLGAKIVFDWDVLVSVIPEVAALTVALFVMQISTAGLAAKYTGNFTWQESLMIGFGMLGRAELAFVVMDIAYVEHQILSEEAFITLMVTAFWLNISVPITIAWWKPYFSGEKRLFRQRSHLP